MRGRGPALQVEIGDPGITPAYAGKSVAGSSATAAIGDHPRACGEEAVTMLYALADEGSPPRVRGRAGRGKARSPR